MSLSRKKSRPIVVDGLNYRFQVSTTRIDDEWNYRLNLTVQCVERNGGLLQAFGILTRNFWLDFPDIKAGKDIDHYPLIKPKHVAEIIKMGISKGWNPKEAGSRFSLELDNAELFLDKT